VDLPGYGFARVPLRVKQSWGEMVETYLRKRNNLMAVVVILDIRRELSAGDRDLLDWLHYYGKKSIVVLTKTDKLSRHKSIARAKRIGNQLQEITSEKPTLFSAKTREGREEIWEKIDRAIEI
jgi:GTP-binding protein